MNSQTLMLYLLKTILISGIMLAYYWIVLRDKKFHYYNRFYLLSASVLSLVIPLLKFNLFTVEQPVLYGSSEVMQLILPTTTTIQYQFGWMDIIVIIVGIVSMILLGFLTRLIFKILLLKRKSIVIPMEGFDFIKTNEENAPFSFFNNLFWKQSISLQDEGGQQIFKHEITHIQQKHTWDRIYCQVIASIFWINPFNWIIQRELMAIHEFIADEEAVGNSNATAFAKMLLQTHYGNHFLNPTHQFFYSSIKRRLAMLTKSTNTKYSYLRRVMVLPVLIVSICLVSIKVHARETIEKKIDAIRNNITILVSDTIHPAQNKRVKLLPPTPPPPSSSSVTAPNVPPPPPTSKPVYYVDGVKITEAEMNKIAPNDIQSVNVWKGEKAINKYPEDGKNGVVEIVTKKVISGIKLEEKNNSQPNELEKVVVVSYKDGNAVVVAGKPLYTAVKIPPVFSKVQNGWAKYLERALDRDLPKKRGAPTGQYSVKVNFEIDQDGKVINVKALNDPGYGTAEEAMRIFESSPRWTPAIQNGVNVKYAQTQEVVFVVVDK